MGEKPEADSAEEVVEHAPALGEEGPEEESLNLPADLVQNDDESSLEDEIGKMAAEMEKHIGSEGLSEVKAAGEKGVGISRAHEKELDDDLLDAETPSVKKAIQELDDRLKTSGKTEVCVRMYVQCVCVCQGMDERSSLD